MLRRLQAWPPAVRLAAAYAAIIMVVSLFFSITLYRVSVNQLDTSLRRQYVHFRIFSDVFEAPPSKAQPSEELDFGSHRLATELVYFNLAILVAGSAASYWLAKRTLRPIEDALEAQSRFTADASHELRTPLAAMQTQTEVALRNPKLSKGEARELLESNLEEVAKLKALSEGLLRLANQDSFEPTKTVQLHKVAASAADRLRPLVVQKQIKLSEDISPVAIKGDETSLVEMAVILLDNAIKYSPAKSTIELAVKPQGKHAILMVKDEGIGIKASDLEHIFERFYRADQSRSKDKTEGYGLGLSIAKKIADMHHGAIEVKSMPSKGSTFTAKLPAAG